MKDFANLDNSSGSFPDVIGVDASGPGETDGTELTADLFNDFMGAFQALLNEVGATPSGSAESGSGVSQILDAIKLIPTTYGLSLLKGVSSEWDYVLNSGTPDHYWESNTNYGTLLFPVYLPAVSLDVDITIRIQPGAARAGTNRIKAQLLYQDGDETLYPIGSWVYDDTTANEQDLVVSLSSYTPVNNRNYILWIGAGNDGATNQDRLLFITVEKSKA